MGPTLAGIVLSAIVGACSQPVKLPTHIRTVDCEVSSAVAEGIRRSPLFRRLVERIDTMHGIVYIESRYVMTYPDSRPRVGALQHRVTVAGAYRLLRIVAAPQSGDAFISLLGHELRHAIEVLESDAATEQDIDRLYARIGAVAGNGATETSAALDAERAIRRELKANRKR